MIGDFLPILLRQLESALTNKLKQILGNMNDFKVHLKFAVLIFESMVTMRGGHQNFFNPVIDERFDIFLG